MERDQARAVEIQEYEVVGATLVPEDDELPMLLRPIMRTRAEPHAYAVLYEQGDEEILVPEELDFIEEKFAEERFYRFPVPPPARAGYRLVQIEAGRPPEYLPAEEAQERFREQGERALRAGARAVSAGALAKARDEVARAIRALPEDPFPILALIAVGRDVLSESQIEVHTWLLHALPPEAIRRRFREARGDSSLAPLVQRVRRDPLCTEYGMMPRWLPAARRSSEGPLPKDMWMLPRAA